MGGYWTMGRESQLWDEMEGGRSLFKYQKDIWRIGQSIIERRHVPPSIDEIQRVQQHHFVNG